MRATLVLVLLFLLPALFVRTYTLPPAPDRRGGTAVMLTSPLRPLFGSPRGTCVGRPEAEPALPCLIRSMAEARGAGVMRLDLPFCAVCHALSQRLALIGVDPAAAQAKQAQFVRFGW